MNKLTPKQEKYVQGLISGLSQREAYKQAGYSLNMDDEKIDIQASKILKTPKVRLRYDELLQEHKNKALWTREEAVNDLIWVKWQAKNDIELNGLRQANSNAFINAIKELNVLEDMSLNNEKMKATIIKTQVDTEFVKERIKLLKGVAKDTSLMEALIDVVKNND